MEKKKRNEEGSSNIKKSETRGISWKSFREKLFARQGNPNAREGKEEEDSLFKKKLNLTDLELRSNVQEKERKKEEWRKIETLGNVPQERNEWRE